MNKLFELIDKDKLSEALENPKDMIVTVHFDENGEADCVCAGSLCVAAGVATEEELQCRRVRWLLLEDVTESEDGESRKLRQDNPVSMFKREEED